MLIQVKIEVFFNNLLSVSSRCSYKYFLRKMSSVVVCKEFWEKRGEKESGRGKEVGKVGKTEKIEMEREIVW